MPKKAQLARFIVNNIMYHGFGILGKSHNKYFLLKYVLFDLLTTLTFYIDYFLGKFPDFKSQFEFL